MAYIQVDANTDPFNQKMKGVQSVLKETESDVNSTGNAIKEMMKQAAMFGGVTIGMQGVKEFASQIVKVRGEYQKLNVAFTTMLGNKEKADALMAQMINTAATTPFQLSEVANGAKQLLAYNVAAEDVNDTLTRLGDIAAGLSVPLNDLVYLYGTTMAQGRLYTQDLNQFTGRGIPMISELAKQFGVAESEVKGLVEAGRVGFPEVQKVIMSLTDEGGKFGGLMSEQSKTIAGQISNIEDAIEQMFNKIGQSNEGFISDTLKGVSMLVENYDKIGKLIASAIAAYGTYKAALMAVNAVQTIQILGLKDSIKWLGLNAAATKAGTAAQAAFNAVANANPYVLLATAIAGLVGVMWSLSDSTDKSADHQARLNDERDRFKKSINEEKEAVNGLLATIKDETATDAQRVAAYEELKLHSSDLTKQYTLEQLQTMKLADAQKALNKEQEKKNIANLATNIEKSEKTLDYLTDLEYNLSLPKGNNNFKQLAKTKDVKEIMKKLGIDNIALDKDTVAKARKELEAQLKGLYTEQEKIINAIRVSVQPKEAYSKAAREAMTAWKKSKKEYEKLLKDQTATKDQVVKAREAMESADTKYSSITGKKASDVIQAAEKEAKERTAAKEKVAKMEADQAVELAKAQQETQFMVEEARINAEKQGFEREIALKELNHRKRLAQIESEKQDQIRAAKEAQRAIFEADKANEDKTWTEDMLNNNKAYNDAVANAERQASAKVDQENFTYFDASQLLAQYQDYDAKRRAIEEKYASDKEQLEAAMRESQEKGNMQMVQNIQASLKQLDMSQAKDLMQNSLDKLKADPAFIDAFQDLKNVSTETLERLYDELQKNKDALSNLDPEQLKVLTDLMTQMEAEVLSRADAFTQYQKAVNDLKDAEAAKAAWDEKARRAQVAYDMAVETFGADSVAAKKKLQELNKVQSQQMKASNDVAKSQNTVNKAWSNMITVTDKLIAQMQAVGDAVGGEVGDVMNFIGSIYSFTTGAMEGIETMSKTTSTAIKNAERASVILLIIQAAIQVFQKLNEITNQFSDSAQYEKAVEKQKEFNKLADSVNEYTLALIKANNQELSWFGDDSVGKLKMNASEMEQAMSNYYDKLNQIQVRYRNQQKNDDNWTMWINPIEGTKNIVNAINGNEYSEQYSRAMNNLRIETRAKKKSFMGIGGHDQETADLRTWAKKQYGDDLFDADGWINGTLAQQIIDSYGDKLQGETKDTIEKLIELKETYENYRDQLKEYVNDLYSPIVENFTQSIMDWLDTGKDALNSFKEYAGQVFQDIVKDMLNTIVLDKVVGTFQDDILDMYTKYSEGNLTEEDLMKQVAIRTNEMVTTYEQQIPVLEQIAGNMQDILVSTTGINIKDASSTSGTTGVSASFTQDSVDEANGRMASLQMGQQAQIEAISALASSMGALVLSSGDSNVMLSDLRDMAAIRNSVLNDMYERMGTIYKVMSEQLTTIANNTNEL